jgi:hypothetical protein
MLKRAQFSDDVASDLRNDLVRLEQIVTDEGAVTAETESAIAETRVAEEQLQHDSTAAIAGVVYVYSLPHYLRFRVDETTSRTYLKVGKTMREPGIRLAEQARATGLPEDPRVVALLPRRFGKSNDRRPGTYVPLVAHSCGPRSRAIEIRRDGVVHDQCEVHRCDRTGTRAHDCRSFEPRRLTKRVRLATTIPGLAAHANSCRRDGLVGAGDGNRTRIASLEGGQRAGQAIANVRGSGGGVRRGLRGLGRCRASGGGWGRCRIDERSSGASSRSRQRRRHSR